MKAEYRQQTTEEADDFWSEIWIWLKKPMLLLIAGSAFWFLLIKPLTNQVNLDNAITQYEWFEQQYADIQATDVQVKDAETSVGSFGRSLPENRSEWSREDKQELSRLNSVLDGLRQYKQSQIAAYNARSRMVTRNLWKSNLPHSL